MAALHPGQAVAPARSGSASSLASASKLSRMSALSASSAGMSADCLTRRALQALHSSRPTRPSARPARFCPHRGQVVTIVESLMLPPQSYCSGFLIGFEQRGVGAVVRAVVVAGRPRQGGVVPLALGIAADGVP